MKPPERLPPDDPREWLNRARSNLAQAREQLPGVYLEDLCFNAQQAAERPLPFGGHDADFGGRRPEPGSAGRVTDVTWP